jgi:hypothetical protein
LLRIIASSSAAVFVALLICRSPSLLAKVHAMSLKVCVDHFSFAFSRLAGSTRLPSLKASQ